MRVTLQQVADYANVSRRTVDRVVNHRGNVRPEVEKKVQNALKELNYCPNKLASALAYSKNEKRVGILFQKDGIREFDEVLERGIKDAIQELQDFGITVEVINIDVQNSEECLGIIDQLVKSGVSGLALRGPNFPEMVQKINELSRKEVPVVTFNSDIPDSDRVCFVGQDLYKSGKIAGNLMAKMVRNDEKILIGCGIPEYDAHHKRLEGFVYELKRHGFKNDQWYFFQGSGQYDITYKKLKKIFEADNFQGIYMSANPKEACGDFLQAASLPYHPYVVCHDISDISIKYLKSGIFDFVIDQNVYSQGYKALHILKDLLRDKNKAIEKYNESDMLIYNSTYFE